MESGLSQRTPELEKLVPLKSSVTVTGVRFSRETGSRPMDSIRDA